MATQTESNFDSFLAAVTPVIDKDHLIKVTNLDGCLHPSMKTEEVESFRLGDFWACFEQCSAYGVPVQVTLQSGEKLTTFFAPYLSAVQIYTKQVSPSSLRLQTTECSTSSGSNSDEGWSGGKISEGKSSPSPSAAAIHNQRNLMPLNKEHAAFGVPYVQFIEHNLPYIRYPLYEQIVMLAKSFPGIMSLRSVDLAPASWMSVAWYPIYTIPMGRRYTDLSACFLTYHHLSSSFHGTNLDLQQHQAENYINQHQIPNRPPVVHLYSRRKLRGSNITHEESTKQGAVPKAICTEDSKGKEREGLYVPPFGLSYYKLQGNIWLSDSQENDKNKLGMLCSAAASWLKRLHVTHPDFNHFAGHRR